MNDADVALDFAPQALDANIDHVGVVDQSIGIAPVSVAGDEEAGFVASKGRMANQETQIFSETIRRLSKSRGGVFEMLSLLPGQVAGQPAQSLEGWVLIITGLAPECNEGDILDYFTLNNTVTLTHHRMNTNRRTSMCVGHAFVEYATREEAEAVVRAMDGRPFLTSDSIGVSPAFLVPEPSAFEQLDRKKRGRRGDDRLGADEVEEEGHEDARGGARAE